LTNSHPENWHQLELSKPKLVCFLQVPSSRSSGAATGLCSDTQTMTATTAELVNLSTTDRNLTGRSDSLNSNSSALARRPRIRSRTRTLPEGSCWSDGSGAPQHHPDVDMSAATRVSPVTGGQLVAEPIQSVVPPRPPRSPQRSMFIPENEVLHAPTRERKISATSTRSVPSSRGANPSLEELLALKSVRLFFHATLARIF